MNQEPVRRIHPEPCDVTQESRRELRPLHDLSAYLHEYAGEKPGVVAAACFALGFMVGWRLKPW
jgi:hypothetical protein